MSAEYISLDNYQCHLEVSCAMAILGIWHIDVGNY